ncbi:hypothetical protein SAMN04487894_102441 [Niabella drilacis]|uniref:Uncharacterized protein n=1 Tax=Niabella drilacis (strain DSM 25811 / CCM 8410 / CCUG 62505 / LMG 26954 / E90) TaxID=1285928 RepID=A0A1G6LRT7_NIADE|nr:hypothetical protein SAMN04487894_102441 [Niabella drilacis]
MFTRIYDPKPKTRIRPHACSDIPKKHEHPADCKDHSAAGGNRQFPIPAVIPYSSGTVQTQVAILFAGPAVEDRRFSPGLRELDLIPVIVKNKKGLYLLHRMITSWLYPIFRKPFFKR